MRSTFVIISQVYVPDPASAGQHIADAASEMAGRGYRTVVYTSARGYEDPGVTYPARESRDGVEIRRLPLSSFGKGSIAVRLVAQGFFVLFATARALFTRGLCGVMVSTSPPFGGIAGALISKLRRVPLKYWIMDLNPDQMVALKKLPPDAVPVRVFDALNRVALRQASDVVVLDRFMAERVNAKLPVAEKLTVLPPWPHETAVLDIPHDENGFRRRHVPEGKFVVMYSGNHSPSNPITVLLDAAERLKDDARLLVLCVGGGAGKKEVEERIARGAANVRSLPYQPLGQLGLSLSSADVHVVTVGSGMVGIVHPCKVYDAMAVSRPILLIGPDPSHVSDLIRNNGIGWHVLPGDVAAAERALREMMALEPGQLRAMGQRAAELVSRSLGRELLCGRFCDVLQRGCAP